MDSFVVTLYRASDGSVSHDLDAAVAIVRADVEVVWVHVTGPPDATTRHLLEERMGFHELAVEDALSRFERPSVQAFDGRLFVVAPVVVGLDAECDTEEVAFFLGEKTLVTVTNRDLPVLLDAQRRLCANPKKAQMGPAYVFHHLLDAVVDGYLPFLDELEERFETIADKVFLGDGKQMQELLKLKRHLVQLRRIAVPVRDELNTILRFEFPQIPAELNPYLRDVYDHLNRVIELVDLNRDTMATLVDVHLSTVSNNLGVIFKKMTVFTTVLMVMALVAGIYGMNFTRMPELHWTYGYPFAIGLMLTLAAGVVGVFKRFGWL